MRVGEGEEAEGGEVGEGLVEMPDEVGEVDGVVEEGELELVVVGAEVVGDGAGVVRARCLASSRKPTLKVLTGSVMELGHERDDEAGVEAAGEHCAERDVAHESQSH